MPSRMPKTGRNYYETPAFSKVPIKGDKIRSDFITHDFSGARTSAELRNRCVLGGHQNKGQNQKWLHNQWILRCPGVRINYDVTPVFSRVPIKRDKIRNGFRNHAFSGAQE